jgi:F-type H+-transporting ATPase subunit delta
VRQSIRGYADGVIALAAQGVGTSPGVIASELAAIHSVIAGSDDLRGVLSDPGVPVASRRAVLADLFGSRVDARTLALVDFVLGAGRAGDTLDDIAWLAERLNAASRDLAPVGDVVLGTKGAEERLEGFAAAVLRPIEEGRVLDDIEDELFRFSRIVAGHEPLRQALTSREVPAEARVALVSDLLAGRARPATLALAAYAARIGRPRDYLALLDHLIEQVVGESQRRLADVRSAVALDDAQQARLAEALSRAVGRPVELRVTVDPALIGGFVATVGDTVVDASVRHRLEVLKERLVMPEADATTGDRQ